MAARVNTKFVVILAVSLVALVGIAGLVAYQAMKKSAGDLAEEGARAFAAGNYVEATKFYSRAVNREQKNIGFINKWIESMEKITPADARDAGDKFQEYMLAVKAAADADRRDTVHITRFLELQRDTIGLFGAGGSLADWEALGRTSEQYVKNFEGSDKDKGLVRFYRGIATAGVVSSNPDLAEDRIKDAIADLESTLVADPGRDEAVLAINQLEVTLADQARRRSDEKTAQDLLNATRSRLQRFIAADGPAPSVQFRLLVMDLQDAARAYAATPALRKDPFPGPQLTRAREDRLKDIVDGLRSAKSEDLDISWTLNIAAMVAEVMPEGKTIANELVDKLQAAHPADKSGIMLTHAGSLQARGDYDTAEKVLDELLKQPAGALSLQSVRLPAIQAGALAALTEIQFFRWLQLGKPEDQPKRQAIAARLDEIRTAMLERVSESDSKVIALDARRQYTKGDFNGARTLATRFNDMTDRRNISMLALEAEILRRGGNSGAAKATFQRIVELNPGNVGAYIQLGEIEALGQNVCETAKYFTQASTLVPNDANLAERARRARELCQGGGEDPEIEAIRKANEFLVGLVRDPAKAIEILEAARQQRRSSPMLATALAQVHFTQGDRASAKRVIDEGLAANPNNAQLKAIARSLDANDPVAAQLTAIESSSLQTHLKSLAKWELLNRNGKVDEAREELKKAKEIAPEDPWVIENLFQDALTRKDKTELNRLTDLAERLNVDQVNGRVFRARREIADERFDEADKILKELVETDKFNVLGWRLKGLVALQRGDNAEAARSLTRAVEINPLDVPSSKALMRAQMQQNRLDDALVVGRRIEKTAGSDEEFANLLLTLESSAPSGNKARAIDARRALATREPKNLLNRVQLTELLINAQKFDEAKALVDQFKKENPGLGAVELEARLLLGQRKVTEAAKLYADYSESLTPDKRTSQLYLSSAELLLGAGAVDKALELLEKGKPTQDAKNREVDRMVGDVQFTAGRFDDCVKSYEAVLAAGSPDEDRKLEKRIIEALLRQNSFKEVDARIAKLGTGGKADETLLLLAAEAASGQGDRAKARQLYDQAVKVNPRSTIAFLKRADFNRPDIALLREVEQDYEQVLRIEPSVIIARVRLGNLYAETGRIDQAIDQFRQATAADPFDTALFDAFLDLLQQRGRTEEAVAAVEDYLKLQPENIGWIARGGLKMLQMERFDRASDLFARVWAASKQPDVAMAYLSALLGKTPPDLTTANDILVTPELKADQSVTLRLMRARWFRLQRKLGEASEQVLAAVALVDQRDPAQCLQLIAGLDIVYPTQDEVLTAMDRLEARSPFTGWLTYQASLLRLRDDKRRPAVVETLTTLAGAGDDLRLRAQSYGLLGTMAYGDADFVRAADMFRKGVDLQPANAELLNNLAFCLAKKLDRGQEALPLAEKAVELLPNNSGMLDTLGVVHLGMKNLDKAAEYLGQAMSLARTESERGPVLLHLAEVRLNQRNKSEARRLLQQAEQIMNNNAVLRESYEPDLKALSKQLDAL
jgi:tetratricopeptide (TPR) repeat protein